MLFEIDRRDRAFRVLSGAAEALAVSYKLPARAAGAIVLSLSGRPVTVDSHAVANGISARLATRDLEAMVTRGLLTGAGWGRGRRFVPGHHLRRSLALELGISLGPGAATTEGLLEAVTRSAAYAATPDWVEPEAPELEAVEPEAPEPEAVQPEAAEPELGAPAGVGPAAPEGQMALVDLPDVPAADPANEPEEEALPVIATEPELDLSPAEPPPAAPAPLEPRLEARPTPDPDRSPKAPPPAAPRLPDPPEPRWRQGWIREPPPRRTVPPAVRVGPSGAGQAAARVAEPEPAEEADAAPSRPTLTVLSAADAAPPIEGPRERARPALGRFASIFALVNIVVGLALILFTAGELSYGAYQQHATDQRWDQIVARAAPPAVAPVVPPGPSYVQPVDGIDFAIRIPKINYFSAVREGIDSNSLLSGPGHYPTMAWPGQPGNVGVAAHNTYWIRFGDLGPGDDVLLETRYGKYQYRIVGSKIIQPTDGSVLRSTPQQQLTLTTCWPLYAGAFAQERLAIFAVQVSPRPNDRGVVS